MRLTMSATHDIPAPDGDTLEPRRRDVRDAFYADEAPATQALLGAVPLGEADRASIAATARAIVGASREMRAEQGTLDAFLHEFGLSNQEGVALMCLAEALLRIPDPGTQDALIAEKIRTGDWDSHLGKSESPFVNAGVWALMLTGKVIRVGPDIRTDPGDFIDRLVKRWGEPVIRRAVNQAMRILGRQFVFGRSIKDALSRQAKAPATERLMSFDMLGEAARTENTAERYFRLYMQAIEAVGEHERRAATQGGPEARSSVSIKLSALHPRYEQTHAADVEIRMLPRLRALAAQARSYNMQLSIDAEEADRLDLSLSLFEALARDPDLAGWDGLGIVIQAYQKRAPQVVDWLAALARETGRRLPVRLVKGAYWDSEIKHAQVLGMPDFPVWTRKAATDLCYLVSARKLLDAPDLFYPQFASHNAYTVAAIRRMAGDAQYEFQRLHGMGDLLYKAAGKVFGSPVTARIYAPVGAHRDLLPYLVRRLLENGANSSFVHRFLDRKVAVEEVTRDPVTVLLEDEAGRNRHIALPADLYAPERRNSRGRNLQDPLQCAKLLEAICGADDAPLDAGCIVSGETCGTEPVDMRSPVNREDCVGHARQADAVTREAAVTAAAAAFNDWNRLGGAQRADILRAMADTLEDNRAALIGLMAREGGKTLDDGIAEVREAVDFLNEYARQAELHFSDPVALPGPTGESNHLFHEGRGVFLAISPWNFPLAIFTGQVAAALAAGNTVIAKPAEQTPLIAAAAVRLFQQAGLPAEALQLLIGTGADVAAPLVADERIAGVAFTGSFETARIINRTLAAREGAIAPLIAETGGQNAMVVDSTALHEQVTDDVMRSAFGSAGQRCSALRILCVQDTVADGLLEMLAGALAERRVGDPLDPATDIGPVIDDEAREGLQAHIRRMDNSARLIARGTLPDGHETGCFLAPHIFEIESLDLLPGEVFGPILHVLRYRADRVGELMEQLKATGFGLTFGIHSRLESRWNDLYARSIAGNVYVNRDMIGAIVGSQPFGGFGLSGTGPKAGGPSYVLRFGRERVRTVNTTAIGGNTDLFRLEG